MSGTVPALYRPVMALTPTLDAARFRWLVSERPGPRCLLPSCEEEAALRRELRAALEPIGLDDLQLHLTRMVSAFPQRANKDLRPYALAMAETLSEYPLDAVAAACRQVIREHKFLPAVAEVVGICEALVRARRAALRNLSKVAEERERRRREAEEAERLRLDREESNRRYDRARARLGEMRPHADLEALWRGLDPGVRFRLSQAAGQSAEALDAALATLLAAG